MKRSASDRYSSYERVCRNMAFDLGFEIYEDDGVVYEITDSGSVIICMATNVKSVWFETWLVMRERIAKSDFRSKNYSFY